MMMRMRMRMRMMVMTTMMMMMMMMFFCAALADSTVEKTFQLPTDKNCIYAERKKSLGPGR